ncbi:hypothetical protein Avbf_15440 [Armadillidium vulgare]|nr:hypothetical protein Avbf_15440 [Armadillidium vulgare]
MSMVESKVEEKKDERTINREKTCPFLLRVFCSNGRHNSIADYRRGNTPANEMDATLKELSDLVLEVNPDARRTDTVFDFSLFYFDLTKASPRVREIGSVTVGQKGFDDQKTLKQLGFVIGDFLDIAISPPGRPMPPRRIMRPY